MATERSYLRNAQTETGTTGTPASLGSVVDLSTTQGTPATLGSGTTQSATFVLNKRFTRTVGTAMLNGSATWAVSISVSAITSDTEGTFRLVRQNSSGAEQSNSGNATAFSTTGTKTHNFTWDPGTWAAGDRLCIETYHRRPAGSGNKTVTYNINHESSFVDAQLSSVTHSAGPLAFTASGAVLAAGADITHVTGALLFAAEGSVLAAGAGVWELIATVGANVETYDDEDLEPGEYCYYVTAFNAAGESAPSNVDCAEVEGAPATEAAWTETAAASDSWSGRQGTLASLTEAAEATDAYAGRADALAAWIEQALADDTFEVLASALASWAESVEASDAWTTTQSGTTAVAWTETAVASETSTAVADALASLTEGVLAGDAYAGRADALAAWVEIVAVADAWTATASGTTTAAWTETAAAADSYEASAIALADWHETADAADSYEAQTIAAPAAEWHETALASATFTGFAEALADWTETALATDTWAFPDASIATVPIICDGVDFAFTIRDVVYFTWSIRDDVDFRGKPCQ